MSSPVVVPPAVSAVPSKVDVIGVPGSLPLDTEGTRTLN